jgi:dihydrofolate synthase/folylpolyglutamate synthase
VLARAGVTIPETAVVEGFRLARWPGRFEAAPGEPRLVWDGAHNADGMAALAHAWRVAGLAPPRAVVLAVARDKDLAALLAILHRWAPAALVFATRTASERALESEAIASAATAAGFHARNAPDVAVASRAALEAVGPEGLVLVTGSLFAVGEAMQAFGGAPGEVL